MSLRSDVEMLVVGESSLAHIVLVGPHHMTTETGKKLLAYLKDVTGRMFTAEMASYPLRERIRILEAEVSSQRDVIDRLTRDLTS